MRLEPRQNKEQIKAMLEQARQQIIKDLIGICEYVGEQFVADARSMRKSEGGFGDITTNLRSSIGYFIFVNGELYSKNLEGSSIGNEAAKKAADNIQKINGIQLIGVAGMDYASAVESKGLNVISYQAAVVFVDLSKLLKEYARNTKLKIR